MRLSIITSVQIWRMLLWCLSDWLKPRNVLSPHQREIFINWEVMWGRGSTKKHSQLKDGVIIFVSSQRWDITFGPCLGFSLSVRTDTKQFYNWRVLSFFPRTSDQRIEKHIWERAGDWTRVFWLFKSPLWPQEHHSIACYDFLVSKLTTE